MHGHRKGNGQVGLKVVWRWVGPDDGFMGSGWSIQGQLLPNASS